MTALKKKKKRIFSPEECVLHQLKPWGKNHTEEKQWEKAWQVFALATPIYFDCRGKKGKGKTNINVKV